MHASMGNNTKLLFIVLVLFKEALESRRVYYNHSPHVAACLLSLMTGQSLIRCAHRWLRKHDFSSTVTNQRVWPDCFRIAPDSTTMPHTVTFASSPVSARLLTSCQIQMNFTHECRAWSSSHSSFGCQDSIERLAILQLQQLSRTQHTSDVPVHTFNQGPNTNRTSRRCK